jgi:hypothetical protein
LINVLNAKRKRKKKITIKIKVNLINKRERDWRR